MKTLKINKLILLLIGLVVFSSCVEDDDFNTPNTSIVEPTFEDTDVISQISSVAGELAQAQGGGSLDYDDENTTYAYTFNENNLYMEGYIISSDEGGNFFEELIVQDKAENPTIGIKVLIDVNPLFVRYEPGRKVYIKLNGLAVGITNGVLTLGTQIGNGIGKIAPAAENETIKRSADLATLVPLPLDFADFSNDKTNLFIELQDVQFNRFQATGDNPLSYASEASDQFDGERTLENCAESGSTVFSTSTFADFKGLTLPSGRGSMIAILTKNFQGENFNIVINTPEDINFEDVERCDPPEVVLGDPTSCGNASVDGSTIYSENFEGYNNIDDAVAAGWINQNFSSGSLNYVLGNFSGSKYAQISGFNTDEANIDVWLISPEINLDNTAEDMLNFDVQTSYNNGEILTVLVTNNYSGSIQDADWSLLEDVNIPSGPSNTFGTFAAAGPINTSCVSGSAVRFAFRYQGADPIATTRYHIDNIEVIGN